MAGADIGCEAEQSEEHHKHARQRNRHGERSSFDVARRHSYQGIRVNADRAHADEVVRADGGGQQQGRRAPPVAPAAPCGTKGSDREGDAERNRGNHKAEIPVDPASNAVGRHAAVMHDADTGTQHGTAQQRAAHTLVAERQGEARADEQNGGD